MTKRKKRDKTGMTLPKLFALHAKATRMETTKHFTLHYRLLSIKESNNMTVKKLQILII